MKYILLLLIFSQLSFGQYKSTPLKRSNNLSDLPSASTARTNLGLSSLSTLSLSNTAGKYLTGFGTWGFFRLDSSATNTKLPLGTRGNSYTTHGLNNDTVETSKMALADIHDSVATKISIANNLSDVGDIAIARGNLGITAFDSSVQATKAYVTANSATGAPFVMWSANEAGTVSNDTTALSLLANGGDEFHSGSVTIPTDSYIYNGNSKLEGVINGTFTTKTISAGTITIRYFFDTVIVASITLTPAVSQNETYEIKFWSIHTVDGNDITNHFISFSYNDATTHVTTAYTNQNIFVLDNSTSHTLKVTAKFSVADPSNTLTSDVSQIVMYHP